MLSSDQSYQDLIHLLPKNKIDFESVEALLNHPNPANLVALLPDLLEWLQDVNWPIFEPVVTVLLRAPQKDLVVQLRRVLRGDDDEHINGIIVYLMPRMGEEALCLLWEDVLDVERRVKEGVMTSDWEWDEDINMLRERFRIGQS